MRSKRALVGAVLLSAAVAVAQEAPKRALSPEEMKVLGEVEHDADHYQEASSQHLGTMRNLLRREYDQKLREVNERFEKNVASAEGDYRKRVQTTLEMLRQFLVKYPNDPRWTPDAMFRLADLYLDESKWQWDEKEAAAAAAPTPPESDAPPPDEDFDAQAQYYGPDFTRSIDLWRDIVKRFPGYRQVDGTVYLLAYYLGEMRQTAESKQAYLGLVCRNKFDPLAVPTTEEPAAAAPTTRGRPKPRVVSRKAPVLVDAYEGCTPMKEETTGLTEEAWVRIGEVHFDTRGELPLAITAYKHVAQNPKSKFYDIALYKLAWSYYRNDQFMDAIQAFDELVVFSDKMEDQGSPPNDLRAESVQYLAISFSDPWEDNAVADPDKALERANAFYKGRTKERHVRDVYEQLGDTLRLSAGTAGGGGEVPPEIATAYRAAIASWRFTLQNWPLHPRDPLVQQKIIDALAYIGDAQAASSERARLAELYRRGSAWYAANEMNRDAMEAANRLGQGSLLEAARNIHRNAQLAKAAYQKNPTQENHAAYTKLYAQAASLYQGYLSEYPSSSQVYELTYRLADCLFFSEQYLKAVKPYRWVRDHKELGTAHTQEAADSIVKSYEAAVEQAKANSAIQEPPVPDADSLAKSTEPIAMPTLYRDLQASYDEYTRLMKDATASTKALAAAMISYRHRDLDDSLARFQAILDANCRSAEAVQAKEGMLAIYQARGQNDKFQAIANRFIQESCGASQADVELAQSQKLSNEYRIAVKNFKDGNYDDAGQEFYALYKTSSTANKDRPGALFNAALAYERAGKPKTAITLYREFTRIPEFQSSEYYIESLFRTAISHQASFDYEAAVDTFLAVVDEAAKPGRQTRPEFNLEQARLDAMFNAAFLRDLDRVYFDRGKNDLGAASLYKRYANAEKNDRKRASQAYFNAALVYEKAGSTKEMIKAFDEWKKQYGRDPGAGLFSVLSQYKIAKALEKSRDKKGAEEYFVRTIRAFDESGEAPGSPASELAAESQFWLGERYYKTVFEPYKVRWLGNIATKDQKKADKAVLDTVNALQRVAKDTSLAYQAVARFQASWSLAAIVRLGDIAFFAGQKLLEAPVPKEIERLDKQYPDQNVLADYQTALEAQVQPNTDTAKDQWLKAVQTAKAAGVSNEWSKLASQRLNSYIAADLYPTQRDELIERETNP